VEGGGQFYRAYQLLCFQCGKGHKFCMDSSENPIGRGNCREIEAVREREREKV
jgi:hypothetical protein